MSLDFNQEARKRTKSVEFRRQKIHLKTLKIKRKSKANKKILIEMTDNTKDGLLKKFIKI